MNPILWLLVVAPTAVLAALLFVWVYEDQTDRAEVQREERRLDRQQFDADFAAAWNGGSVSVPNPDEMEQTRTRLAALEAEREAKEQERCQRMAALANDLQGVLQPAQTQNNDCKDDTK